MLTRVCCQESPSTRTHYPCLQRTSQCTKIISTAILIISAACALYTLFLEAGYASNTGNITKEDVQSGAIFSGFAAGVGVGIRASSWICGRVQTNLDIQRDGALTQAELALLV